MQDTDVLGGALSCRQAARFAACTVLSVLAVSALVAGLQLLAGAGRGAPQSDSAFMAGEGLSWPGLAGATFVWNLGMMLLAAMIMAVLHDRMVARHLRRLAILTRQPAGLNDVRRFTLDRRGPCQDDLEQIVDALNDADVQIHRGHVALRTRTNELEVLNEQLHSTNREQAEFTYSISHDLKAPTNTMGMLIAELQDVLAEGDDATDVLADMQATNQRMGQLVEDVLRYSRIIEETVRTEPVDLDALIADIMQDLSADIGAAEAQIECDNLGVLDGHAVHLRILFQNLLSNAIKFRRPDRAPLIRMTRRRNSAGRDVICVADNGIGIPEQHRSLVFGLFKRLHARSAYEGSGLGLTICRRVMAGHGGAIRLGTGMDGGAAFELTFWEDEDE